MEQNSEAPEQSDPELSASAAGGHTGFENATLPAANRAPTRRISAQGLKVAVQPLEIRESAADIRAAAATELLLAELDKVGFQVITPEDIRAAFGFKDHADLFHCDLSCMTTRSIAAGLSVDMLVTGSVGVLGETRMTSLKLIRLPIGRNARAAEMRVFRAVWKDDRGTPLAPTIAAAVANLLDEASELIDDFVWCNPAKARIVEAQGPAAKPDTRPLAVAAVELAEPALPPFVRAWRKQHRSKMEELALRILTNESRVLLDTRKGTTPSAGMRACVDFERFNGALIADLRLPNPSLWVTVATPRGNCARPVAAVSEIYDVMTAATMALGYSVVQLDRGLRFALDHSGQDYSSSKWSNALTASLEETGSKEALVVVIEPRCTGQPKRKRGSTTRREPTGFTSKLLFMGSHGTRGRAQMYISADSEEALLDTLRHWPSRPPKFLTDFMAGD